MTGESGGGEMAGMNHYAARRSHRVSQLQSTERGSNKNKCPHITQLYKLYTQRMMKGQQMVNYLCLTYKSSRNVNTDQILVEVQLYSS